MTTNRCFNCGSRQVTFRFMETGEPFCTECTSEACSALLDKTADDDAANRWLALLGEI